MPTPNKTKNRFIAILHKRYRLTIRHAETFEQKFSITFTGLGFLVFNGLLFFLLVAGTILLIGFTQLREYIPGYGSLRTHGRLMELSLRTDSLANELRMKENFILNIQNIVEGKDIVDFETDTIKEPPIIVDVLERSPEDSILRVEMQRLTALQPTLPVEGFQGRERISQFFFFPPVRGLITNFFLPARGHFGIDLVANANEPIKATLEGSVLFAQNNIETGNTIAIQHANNIISIYKHLAVMLKRQGDRVNTGEVIGIIGNTGLLSTGLHLHFELWYQGVPVNPQDFIVF